MNERVDPSEDVANEIRLTLTLASSFALISNVNQDVQKRIERFLPYFFVPKVGLPRSGGSGPRMVDGCTFTNFLLAVFSLI